MRHSIFKACALLALVLLSSGNATAAQQDAVGICSKASGDAALAACSKVIASGRYTGAQLAMAYFNRGKAAFLKNNYGQSIVDLSAAIKIDGSNYRYYTWRGTAYEKLGNYRLAISDYNTYVDLNPDRAEALHLRGEFFAGVAKYDLAFADLNESLRLRPYDASTLDGRGRAYLLTKQFDKAMRDFDAAVRLKGFVNSLYARGWAKLQTGDIAGGNSDIAQAKAQNPGVGAVYDKYYGITH